MAKKRHMTKHQYAAYKKQHRYDRPFEIGQEEGKHGKSNHSKSVKKHDEKMRKLLRNIQEDFDDMLDEEYEV